MTTATTQKLLTAEEFMKLPDPPDGSRQELIRGRVVTMPLTQGRHGIVCLKVGRVVGDFVEANRLGHATSNDAGFIGERGPDTVRGPDVAFYSFTRAPEVPDGYFEVAPDLAIEVVSPSDTHTRVQEKVRYYLRRGVRLVWVIDPELRIVTAYQDQEWRTLEETDTLTGGDVLPGFNIIVANLFPPERAS
jgi:Uma2 family endonuclease